MVFFYLFFSSLTFDGALGLFAMTGAAFLGVLSSDESESELLSTFLDFFLSSTLAATTTGFFLSASFYDLFFESSILTFLDGASDELTDTCFFFSKKII